MKFFSHGDFKDLAEFGNLQIWVSLFFIFSYTNELYYMIMMIIN
jgi:hypothetical protein